MADKCGQGEYITQWHRVWSNLPRK